MSSSGSFGCWCVCVSFLEFMFKYASFGSCPASSSDSRQCLTPRCRRRLHAKPPWIETSTAPRPSSVSGRCVRCLRGAWLDPRSPGGPLRFLSRLGLSAELQIRGGLEEARVAVLLHQGVDFGLGQVEGRPAGVLQQLLGDGFCRVVQIDLGRNRRREHRDKPTGQMSSLFVANHLPLWAPPLR